MVELPFDPFVPTSLDSSVTAFSSELRNWAHTGRNRRTVSLIAEDHEDVFHAAFDACVDMGAAHGSDRLWTAFELVERIIKNQPCPLEPTARMVHPASQIWGEMALDWFTPPFDKSSTRYPTLEESPGIIEKYGVLPSEAQHTLKSAIQDAIHAGVRPIASIAGPQGTSKTKTTLMVIVDHVGEPPEDGGKRKIALVISPRNHTVDDFAEKANKLIPGINKVVRFHSLHVEMKVAGAMIRRYPADSLDQLPRTPRGNPLHARNEIAAYVGAESYGTHGVGDERLQLFELGAGMSVLRAAGIDYQAEPLEGEELSALRDERAR